MKSNVVAIVPARKGSKGFPGKNIQELCGKPLYRHSVDAALSAGITQVWVSTDIEEIFEHDLPAGVKVLRRPEKLAGDVVPMRDVVADIISSQNLHQTTLVLLQPTSPLRKPRHVLAGLEMFKSTDWSLVMGICEAPSGVLKWGTVADGRFMPISDPKYCFSNRQSLPSVFRPNGALYIFDADDFRARGDFASDAIGVVVMTNAESLDIDTEADFEQCQRTLAKGADE
jgi:N-acylneuraminate cytidylyltransferase